MHCSRVTVYTCVYALSHMHAYAVIYMQTHCSYICIHICGPTVLLHSHVSYIAMYIYMHAPCPRATVYAWVYIL